MDALELIDALEEAIEKGGTVPLTGKCLLDKDELLDFIQEIRLKLPEDLKQAKWVKEERQRIITEAQKEANNLLKSAEDKIISMINEHEITKKSYEQAREIDAAAQKRAKEIKMGTVQYVEDLLFDAEKVMEETMTALRENRQQMRVRNKERKIEGINN